MMAVSSATGDGIEMMISGVAGVLSQLPIPNIRGSLIHVLSYIFTHAFLKFSRVSVESNSCLTAASESCSLESRYIHDFIILSVRILLTSCSTRV